MPHQQPNLQPDPSEHTDPQARRLRELRTHRVWREPASPISMLMQREKAKLERASKNTGGAGTAFERIVREKGGDRLADACMIEGVSRGVLSVRTPTSAVRYELDRLLRAGAEREIIRGAGVSISRIKVR